MRPTAQFVTQAHQHGEIERASVVVYCRITSEANFRRPCRPFSLWRRLAYWCWRPGFRRKRRPPRATRACERARLAGEPLEGLSGQQNEYFMAGKRILRKPKRSLRESALG